MEFALQSGKRLTLLYKIKILKKGTEQQVDCSLYNRVLLIFYIHPEHVSKNTLTKNTEKQNTQQYIAFDSVSKGIPYHTCRFRDKQYTCRL